MRGAFVVAAAALLAGCAGPPTQTIGATPAMISICQDPADPWQKVLDMAQAHCTNYGKNAEVSARGDRCLRGTGTIIGQMTHFRCTVP